MKSSFLTAGHLPTLFAAFLYFDLSFMVWVMLGPLAVQIARDLGLLAAQKGLMAATPVVGALSHMPDPAGFRGCSAKPLARMS